MEGPSYNKIYHDLIAAKFPGKRKELKPLLQKELAAIDVIKLNKILFGKSSLETAHFNQRHRFYDKKTILGILNYQKKNDLNNTQTAAYFNLSRNTLAKWKKIYLL